MKKQNNLLKKITKAKKEYRQGKYETWEKVKKELNFTTGTYPKGTEVIWTVN